MVLEIRLARHAKGPAQSIALPVNINTVSWKSFTEALKSEYLKSPSAVISHLILIDADGDEASGQLRDITRFKKFLQTKCGPWTFFVVAVAEGEDSLSATAGLGEANASSAAISSSRAAEPEPVGANGQEAGGQQTLLTASVDSGRISKGGEVGVDCSLHQSTASVLLPRSRTASPAADIEDSQRGALADVLSVTPHSSFAASPPRSDTKPSQQLASERLMNRFGMTRITANGAKFSEANSQDMLYKTSHSLGTNLSSKDASSPINTALSSKIHTNFSSKDASSPINIALSSKIHNISYSGNVPIIRSSSRDNKELTAAGIPEVTPVDKSVQKDTCSSPAVLSVPMTYVETSLESSAANLSPVESEPRCGDDENDEVVIVRFKLAGSVRDVNLRPGSSWDVIELALVNAFSLPAIFCLDRLNLMDSNHDDAFSVMTTDKRFWKAVNMRYADEPGMYFLAHPAKDCEESTTVGFPSPVIEPVVSSRGETPSAVNTAMNLERSDTPKELSEEVPIVTNKNFKLAKTVNNSFVQYESVPPKNSKTSDCRLPVEVCEVDSQTANVQAKAFTKAPLNSNDATGKNGTIKQMSNSISSSSPDKLISARDVETARKLKSNNYDDLTSRQVTEFLQACGIGDIPKILHFVRTQKLALSVKDSEGMSALHVSALCGHLEVVKYILLSAEESYVAGNHTCSPVSLCSAMDQFMMTPLHYACEHDNLYVAEMLLKYGADICARNTSGSTPLHIICLRGSNSMVGLIGEAQVNVATDSGLTLLHCAADQGHVEVCRALVHLGGVSVNSRDDRGLTPMHYACIAGHQVVAELLVDHGAYSNPRDDDGMSPLLYAAQRGQLKVLLWLLTVGANMYTRDNWGCTAVHLACESGHLSIVKVLHEKKMDLNARNTEGSTPLELASIEGHDKIAVWMEDHGAWMRPETEAQAHIRRQVDAKAEAAVRAFEVEEEANLVSGDFHCKCNAAIVCEDNLPYPPPVQQEEVRKGGRWF